MVTVDADNPRNTIAERDSSLDCMWWSTWGEGSHFGNGKVVLFLLIYPVAFLPDYERFLRQKTYTFCFLRKYSLINRVVVCVPWIYVVHPIFRLLMKLASSGAKSLTVTKSCNCFTEHKFQTTTVCHIKLWNICSGTLGWWNSSQCDGWENQE